jgi:hypothetical protein
MEGKGKKSVRPPSPPRLSILKMARAMLAWLAWRCASAMSFPPPSLHPMPRRALKRLAFSFCFLEFPPEISVMGPWSWSSFPFATDRGISEALVATSKRPRARLPFANISRTSFISVLTMVSGERMSSYNITYGVSVLRTQFSTSVLRAVNGSINVTPRLCHHTVLVAQRHFTLCLASGMISH